MNSIASAAIRSSATLGVPLPFDATSESSARPCVATRSFVHERIHTFIHSATCSLSTVHPQISPRSPVGKPPPESGLACAHAIEGGVAELRAHRVERRVQPRDARAGDEIELLAADHPAHRDADEPDPAHLAGIAI